ncbi:cell envelope integrity protein TolA [Psychromonas aquimarina]|uniref:cell envelope integrity protein TolA n=1 Tax=Psychromonas aquimarina TaxID=444919 RepID=UPI0006869F54|nr:cell envelope integrity protein TolA [Psychromonas aquimarina]
MKIQNIFKPVFIALILTGSYGCSLNNKVDKSVTEKEYLHQAELDNQMERAFDSELSNAQNSKQLSEINFYQDLIQKKIGRNWRIDPSMKGKTCTLAIRVSVDGLVLRVKPNRGDVKVCASARNAVISAGTLPIPNDPVIAELFRDFDITLEPNI